jgi:lysophospholipase L1-like esterase
MTGHRTSGWWRRRQFAAGASAFLVLAVLVPAGPVSQGSAETSSPDVGYYVSLGDSYAAGYQPVASAAAHRDTDGFAYQIVRLAQVRGYSFSLCNFACDGATSTSLVRQKGCPLPAPGPDSMSYPTLSQAAAADQFVAHHRGHIGLVTVSIGGNDILGCAAAANFDSCVTATLPTLESNLHRLLTGLRKAAGSGVPIVGITYPDVFIGLYTSSDPDSKKLAVASLPVFQNLLNPALAAEYGAVGGTFVDVTRATGAYTPLSETTPSGPHEALPVAVADICLLTYECQFQDVHPTNRGYALIARLIVATLPRRR